VGKTGWLFLFEWNIDGIGTGNDSIVGSIPFDPLGDISWDSKLVVRDLLCAHARWCADSLSRLKNQRESKRTPSSALI